MASGSYSSSTGVKCNVRANFWSSTNTATNTSSVTMTAYLDYYAPLYMGSRTLTFSCDGKDYNVTTAKISDGGRGEKHRDLGSWTVTVDHNNDGSKICYIGISIPLNITYSGKPLKTVSTGGTVNLDTIPRRSTIDALGDFNVEAEHWIDFTKNSPSFWQNVWIQARKSGTNNDFETVGVFAGYTSGQHMKFNPENIAQVYRIAMPDTNVSQYVDVLYHLETWTSKGGTYIGEDSRVVKGFINGTMFTNVKGTWKKCVPFVNVDGLWKPCISYENVNRSWKPTLVL